MVCGVGAWVPLGVPTATLVLSSLPLWPSREANFGASLGGGRAAESQFFLLFEGDLDSPGFWEFLLLFVLLPLFPGL